MTVATPVPSLLYSAHVNPQWVRLLNVLEMNVRYERCIGTELFTRDGRTLLDFLSGYCGHNIGHNHPEVLAALKAELDRQSPAMLQSHVPQLAGVLAGQLCLRGRGRLTRVRVCGSRREGSGAAIVFSLP